MVIGSHKQLYIIILKICEKWWIKYTVICHDDNAKMGVKVFKIYFLIYLLYHCFVKYLNTFGSCWSHQHKIKHNRCFVWLKIIKISLKFHSLQWSSDSESVF